jgi:nitrogen fixation/metabolism regulation signal transduction histidine kinase
LCGEVSVEDLSLHILDIVENSVGAGASSVDVSVTEDLATDWLTIEIVDDGAGMEPERLKRVLDPFETTRTTRRVGLGLPLLEQAAATSGGDLKIESEPGKGTRVFARFRHGHIDRQPLGDLRGTILALVVGYPGVDLRFQHRCNGENFTFDTRAVKEALGDVRINSASGIRALRKALQTQ